MNNERRWKQRFVNFEKAYSKFSQIAAIDKMGEIEKMALVQAFEFTFELAWKMLKDYLEDNGFEVNSPKETIRQAYQSDYIKDGETWMNALKKRNETSHIYNELLLDKTARFIIDEFWPAVRELYYSFKKETEKGS